jgi:hypothetical protein
MMDTLDWEIGLNAYRGKNPKNKRMRITITVAINALFAKEAATPDHIIA